MSNKETFLGKNFHEKRGKKGQVTIFIIVGILIVIIAGGLIFVNRDKISFRGTTSVQVEPVRNFIEECSLRVLDESLLRLKQNAGHYNLVGIDNSYGLSSLKTSTYFPNDVIEGQISDDIKYELENNCDLIDFEQEYEMQKGEINVETEINWHEVIVDINYPITLIRGDSSLNLGNIIISKESDFGIMNAVAGKIINDEVYGNGFELVDWKENSIFRDEEVEVNKVNDVLGPIYFITTLFEDRRYAFILER